MHHLFVSLYRLVPVTPVLHRLLAAETADPVGGAREVEAGPRQPLHRHLLGQARVPERVQAPVDDGVVVVVVRLQVTVLCEVSHVWQLKG